MTLLIFGNDSLDVSKFTSQLRCIISDKTILFGSYSDSDITYDDLEKLRGLNHTVLDGLNYEVDFVDFWHSCDRNSANGARYKLVESLYTDYTSAWSKILLENEITSILYMTIPHTQWCASLHATANALNVESISLFPTIEKNIKILFETNSFHSFSNYKNKELTSAQSKLVSRVTNKRYEYMTIQKRTFIRNLKSPVILALPASLLSLLSSILSLTSNRPLIRNSSFAYHFTSIEMKKMSRNAFFTNLKSKLTNQKCLYDEYSKVSKNIDFSLERKFVYLPLHYQPEATTFPLNRKYADQFKFACSLAKELQAFNVSLVIKEHPSTFAPMLRGDRGRYSNFYQQLSRLKNVEVASLKTSSEQLIQKSLAVVSLNGTASAEKAAVGGKAVVFASHWASLFPTFLSCKTIEECVQFIAGNTLKDTKLLDVPVVYDLENTNDMAFLGNAINEFMLR